MATTTFTWVPDNGSPTTFKPRILSGRFGDGYEQRVKDGINNNPAEKKLTFSAQTLSERNAIMDFLSARGGVEAFNFTDYSGVTGVYVCKEWEESPTSAAAYHITATFEQVFE